MAGDASYWLKIERAYEHFVELEELIAPYNEPRPCRIGHTVEGKRNEHVYRTYPTEDADPGIAIVIGDFMFNLRSALDHLRAALVPRKHINAGDFPIVTKDLWEQVPGTQRYVYGQRTDEADSRRRFRNSTKGMRDEAVAKLLDFQPFRSSPEDVPHRPLTILKKLQNADKHRELIALTASTKQLEVTIRDGAKVVRNVTNMGPTDVGAPGAELHRSKTEVEVEARGPLLITIGAGKDRQYPARDTCGLMFRHVRDEIIPALEPFVLR